MSGLFYDAVSDPCPECMGLATDGDAWVIGHAMALVSGVVGIKVIVTRCSIAAQYGDEAARQAKGWDGKEIGESVK